MEVVLKQDVSGLGRKGDAVKVKDGYARNFLLPKGVAVPATKGTLKEQESLHEAKKDKEDRLFLEAQKDGAAVDGKSVVFQAKAGQGRLFGSITPEDIAVKIQKMYRVKVDKRKVLLDENLKELGEHQVFIQLHPKVRVRVSVEIRAEAGK